MNKSVRRPTVIALSVVVLALAASGCATKKYVAKQTGVVNQRVNQLESRGKAEFAKQQAEISRLDERVATVDNKLGGVANTAQQANASAGQALQQAQTNASAIQSNTSDISAHSTQILALTNDLNYALVDTENIIFGFNKADLTTDARAALDLIVQKATTTKRPIVEVVGYTDDIGSKSYNLALSRKRADAVARYLVKQNVPLKGISLIGLGEEQSPELLAAELKAVDPAASKTQLRSLARRVRIRLYAPGATSTEATNTSAQVQP
jgi:outer membrane protein OmpA-like peptidoglycan-associated protein